MATHPKKAVAKTPLEAFAQAPAEQHIALLLWKNRIANPDMAVLVNEEDLKAYMDCMSYLKVTPEVKVVRRPKYVGIVLVEKGTGDEQNPGNAIRPVENNQADFDRSQEASRARRARENAPSLAAKLRADAESGTFSSSLAIEAADTLVLLSAG